MGIQVCLTSHIRVEGVGSLESMKPIIMMVLVLPSIMIQTRISASTLTTRVDEFSLIPKHSRKTLMKSNKTMAPVEEHHQAKFPNRNLIERSDSNVS